MKILQKTILLFICTICLMSPIMNINAYATEVDVVPDVTISDGKVKLRDSTIDSSDKAKSTIIDRYKELITFFGGIATISMIAIFIKHFIELGAKASNPMERRQITSGLIWSGLAAACLGSVTFLFSIAYGILQ